MTFVAAHVPPLRTVLTWGPACFAWGYACLEVSARLKRAGVRTGYTRKLFHVLTFMTVLALHQGAGLSLVCVHGGAVSLLVLHAVVRGAGHPHFEALAREQDAPHRARYIVLPYLATLAGGLASNAWFGTLAMLGYLVAGLGDAAGEPVGARWGRHPYRVPSLGARTSTRTWEGSLGVLAASLLALIVGVWLCPELVWSTRTALLLPVLATGCAALEAASPHGWDNATMQLGPACMAALLL